MPMIAKPAGMVVATFGGDEIFGFPTMVIGPVGTFRSQQHYLPGVDGFRNYRLGAGPNTFQVRGQLIGTSGASVENFINGIIADYIDGNLYQFVSNNGVVYSYCLLDSFRPDSNYQGIRYAGALAVRVSISAVITQINP